MSDPAANAQTFYFRQAGRHILRPSYQLKDTRCSDPQTGRVRQGPGAWTGRLTAKPITIIVTDQAETPKEGFHLTGRLVNVAGRPISGARVRVRKRIQSGGGFDGYAMATPDHDLTDDAGKFAFARSEASLRNRSQCGVSGPQMPEGDSTRTRLRPPSRALWG